MTERLRQWAAHREIRAALAARRPRPLPPDPRHRRVLLLLPDDDAALHVLWALVGQLDLPDRLLRPVRVGDHVGYAPDRFAGTIRVIGADQHDGRRLPRAAVRADVWGEEPDVALNLAPASDLGAALLAGASPAAVRIGLHAPDREPFYDLMVRAAPDLADSVAALARLLRHLDPPVVPFRPC